MTQTTRAMTILSAAALLTLSLAMPASANDDPADSALRISDVSSANVPLPRARPAGVRKRIASAWPAHRAAPPRQIFGPYRPMVVAHWPVLMLGVGY